MKYILLLVSFFLLTGCTTLKPINMTSSELQEQIFVQKLVKPGDKINIVTTNGEAQQITVTALKRKQITGENHTVKGKKNIVEIPVNNIKSIDAVEFSPGKTVALVAGIFVTLYAMKEVMDSLFLDSFDDFLSPSS